MAKILVVDDEPKMTSLICGTLEDAGHAVTTTVDPTEALTLIEKQGYDIIITDLSMPGVSGMEILKKGLASEGADVVMMTAFGTIESAVEAMKLGAADYLTKPFSFDELTLLVERLTEKQRLASLTGHYASQLRQNLSDRFIGPSEAAAKVRQGIERVAKTEATVLITGKSGTGKELVAQMIHDSSPRANQPFIAINCAAITETLLESELFGHEKGSFTGASARKHGRFELANKGTIFLDEIGEMPLSMQPKLLRVLEERQMVRVGGVDNIKIDVRVIAATNRNPRDEVQAKRFREDLYFRLNVFPLELPPLSARKEDIIPIAEFLLSQHGFDHLPLDKPVTNLLTSYDWPGNVRELRNVLERAVILSGSEPLTVEEFSLQVDDQPLSPIPEAGSTGGLEGAERQMILSALEKAGGNKTEAARLLKITRRRLYSRMKVLGLD
jgi:two-component system NtrC family response regulator